MTNPPGHAWRDKWTALSGTLSRRVWDASTGALLFTMDFLSGVTSVAWGCDWLRELQRREAFAMGWHPRLGAGSRVLRLDEGLVKMILED